MKAATAKKAKPKTGTADSTAAEGKRITLFVSDAGRLKEGGDICESYSADLIANSSTIRKPFSFNGKPYIAVSGGGGRVEAYELVKKDQFDGLMIGYGDADKMNGPGDNFYHGVKVKHGRQELVMKGPEVLFAAEGSIDEKDVEEPAAAEAVFSETDHEYRALPIGQIVPSATEIQARRRAKFTDEELDELAASIRANGLIQPITVRPKLSALARNESEDAIVEGLGLDSRMFEIVAGERRYLACKRAGLQVIDSVIRRLSDSAALDIQITENLQRKDVDPIDEAFSFKALLEAGQYTVHDLAIRLGRPEKFIRQRLRLNDLIPEVLELVSKDELPIGHALEIAKYPAETQKVIHEEEMYLDYGEEPLPLADFRSNLRDEISLKLSDACFDIADGTLHPEGIACGSCSQRTGFEPLLFEDELKDGDACLNKKCYDAKALVQLTRQRDAVAAEIRIAKQVPIDKPVDVPLVTESYYYEGHDGPIFKKGEKVLERQKLLETAECDHASPALIVKGERKGQQTYICTKPNSCKKHRQKSSSSTVGEATWELERKEQMLQRDIANAVRRKVLLESAGLFTDRAFWADKDLLTDAVVVLYNSKFYYAKDVIAVWDPKAPNDGTTEPKIRSYVAGLSTEKISQLIFILTYCYTAYSNYSVADHAPLLELNDRYAKLEYAIVDAETRVELAPDQFKPKAEEYLTAVKGKKKAKPPTFWWPKETKKGGGK